MARTPSTMLPLGTQAPSFSLLNIDGRTLSLSDVRKEAGLVVMFISNHCPFVIHIKEAIADLAREFGPAIGMVAIGSNDVENYPQDGIDGMRKDHAQYGYSFPYLHDADQTIAKAYEAACTPEFYLFDSDLKLVYRGQFDGSRPGNDIPVTGSDLRTACTGLLNGDSPIPNQVPSLGCNIKWKPGNEPDYYQR